MSFCLCYSFYVIPFLSMWFSIVILSDLSADSLRPLAKFLLQFQVTNRAIINLHALIDALQMQVDCENQESKI